MRRFLDAPFRQWLTTLFAFRLEHLSTRPPPRYVVQTEDDPAARRKRWLWLALIWLLSLVVVGGGAYWIAGSNALVSDHGDGGAPRQLQRQNDDLKQQVATLSRSLQVSQVATQSLKDTLAKREEKINGLRADLAFYSHLIGGGAQHHGLRIQDVHLTPVDDSRAWNITITLTHNVKRGSDVKGTVKVAVQGILKGKLTRLSWHTLSGDSEADGLDFEFRYFQQVHGTLMLPEGFTPNRIRVDANPTQGKTAVRQLDWSDALKKMENNHVQQ